MLGRRHVDAVLLVRTPLPDAAERDGLGRRGRRDRVGFLEEPPDLGAPGLLARLALVREQMVEPGYAVHGGGEGVVFQPALLEAVGQVPGPSVPGPSVSHHYLRGMPRPSGRRESGAPRSGAGRLQGTPGAPPPLLRLYLRFCKGEDGVPVPGILRR